MHSYEGCCFLQTLVLNTRHYVTNRNEKTAAYGGALGGKLPQNPNVPSTAQLAHLPPLLPGSPSFLVEDTCGGSSATGLGIMGKWSFAVGCRLGWHVEQGGPEHFAAR